MVWGAYGANAVHFSVLQEFIAAAVGVPVGFYWQVANNFHAYLSTLGKAGESWPWMVSQDAGGEAPPVWYEGADPYGSRAVKAMPMFSDMGNHVEVFQDIDAFLKDPAKVGIRSNFLRKVACPMVMAHRAYKRRGGLDGILHAREILDQVPADNDWKAGAVLWLSNREAALKKQSDDGVSYAD
jgi:hypothetical protein